MKRIYKLIMVFVLMLTLVGCNTAKSTNKNADTFDTFIETLPKELMSSNGFDLNYTVHDASAYGIEKEVGDIYSESIEEYQDSFDECKELLTELESYDYDSLTSAQQLEYDVLKDYLDRQLLLEEYISFDNNYLGSFIGFQAQLPVLLLEYEIHDKQDLETYVNVLKTSPEAFKGYADLEKERQEKGTGMSQVLIDGVIEQCENFASGDVAFLVDEMNGKIDEATFLTEEEKTQAKKDNEEYTNNNFLQAYVVLKEELEKLEPEQTDGGIASQEDGGAYYQALFQNVSGLDWTIKELEEYLSDKETEYTKKLVKMISKDPDLQKSMFNQTYGDFDTANENIDYLASKYTKYFPEAGTMQYRIVDVPVSMQDNFSPAAYLTSRIDREDDEPLLILINGGYSSDDFTTIAHEGYPGHMYQDCYFQKLDVSPFRYLISCKGYSEGWAKYIEGKAYWFTENDNAKELEANTYNEKLSYTIWAKWDIDINYYGMSREEFSKEITSVYGKEISQEVIDDQYTQLMETPTNYLLYYVTALYFEDLYNEASAKLGDKFDPVAFHKVILDTGSTGMSVVNKRVDAYIEENE